MVGDSRIEIFKLKEAVIVRLHALGIGERRAFKNDRSAGNDTIIDIGHRTDDRSSLRFGCGDLLSYRCTGDRRTENKETQAMLCHLPSSLFDIVLVDFFHLCRSDKSQLKTSPATERSWAVYEGPGHSTLSRAIVSFF